MFANSVERFSPKLIDVGVDFAKASLRIVLIVVAAYIGLRLLRLALNRLETLLIRAAVGEPLCAPMSCKQGARGFGTAVVDLLGAWICRARAGGARSGKAGGFR